MPRDNRPPDAFWNSQLAEHNAVVVNRKDRENWPKDRAVAFETLNFGWILSACDPVTGFRKCLLQY